jgi:hypothetical protein
MKLDVTSLDVARADRSGRLAAVLVGAGLALVAGGIVLAALWSVWNLAEIVP